jgi:GAF domain-containing protein
MVNIPFYFADTLNTDCESKESLDYLTYRLLALPLIDEEEKLVAVVQLLNLCLEGKVPKTWQTSFDESDCKYMQIFNNQVGVILQNTELLEAVRRQEQNLRDSLSQSPTDE